MMYLLGTIIICGVISVRVLSIMQETEIKNKSIRKFLVNIYKKLLFIVFVTVLLGSVGALFEAYGGIYKFLYNISMIFTNNSEFARYVSLSFILIATQPGVFLFLKLMKKKLFEDAIGELEAQDIGTYIINTLVSYTKRIPVKGIIHVVNLILVVGVNVSKALNIDTNLTSTSVYMSIATFYAVDKVIEYFRNQYKEYWRIIDNKLFKTEEIDSGVKYNINKLRNIMGTIFFHYIETGKFEWK